MNLLNLFKRKPSEPRGVGALASHPHKRDIPYTQEELEQYDNEQEVHPPFVSDEQPAKPKMPEYGTPEWDKVDKLLTSVAETMHNQTEALKKINEKLKTGHLAPMQVTGPSWTLVPNGYVFIPNFGKYNSEQGFYRHLDSLISTIPTFAGETISIKGQDSIGGYNFKLIAKDPKDLEDRDVRWVDKDKEILSEAVNLLNKFRAYTHLYFIEKAEVSLSRFDFNETVPPLTNKEDSRWIRLNTAEINCCPDVLTRCRKIVFVENPFISPKENKYVPNWLKENYLGDLPEIEVQSATKEDFPLRTIDSFHGPIQSRSAFVKGYEPQDDVCYMTIDAAMISFARKVQPSWDLQHRLYIQIGHQKPFYDYDDLFVIETIRYKEDGVRRDPDELFELASSGNLSKILYGDS